MKLPNVVVKEIDKNGNLEIKVTDFGFATYFEPKKNEKLKAIGSGIYKAPELFTGAKVSDKVDIWAVGVMTYTMIAGYEKFPFKTPNQVKKG